MSQKSRFRGPFDKHHGKHNQALLKSASHHLYLIPWSLPQQLIWKKSLLLICQILGLLIKTLAADEKYPLLNRYNLTKPSQMQLSQKQKTFSQIFAAFLQSRLNFEHFQRNDESHSFKQKLFLNFLLNFWNIYQILNVLKKRWPSKLLYFRNYRL